MHGLGAEDGVQQCYPTWKCIPEGGAGGELEELPEESCSPGGTGRVTEGQTAIS